jgi:hypothetical protein
MAQRFHMRVDKRTWYHRGGFKNPALFRRHRKGRGWTYWIDVSRWLE